MFVMLLAVGVLYVLSAKNTNKEGFNVNVYLLAVLLPEDMLTISLFLSPDASLKPYDINHQKLQPLSILTCGVKELIKKHQWISK